MQFLLNANVHPSSVMPAVATALSSKTDSTAVRADYSLLISAFDFICALREIALASLPKCRCQVRSVAAGGYDVIVRPPSEDDPLFYAYARFDEDKDVFVPRRLHFSVQYWGGHEVVEAVARAMGERFGHSRLATVEWWYQTKDGADYRSITMQPPAPVHDSYYPWLGEPVASYFARYLEDSASVLFIMGEPGTGKTSLLRHFIYEHQLKAVITYEEQLLNSDEMFVNFLSMGDDAVLVIEDAESLVNAREIGGGTTLMTRFLNVSDGLVHLANRKIIFTTNQNDFRGVDPALIRPGRCFGAVKARALSYGEACAAAHDAGLPQPTDTGGPIILADLFNPEQSQAVERIGVGIGR
jgi:ATPase family associated with various cellular activities (AAA)